MFGRKRRAAARRQAKQVEAMRRVINKLAGSLATTAAVLSQCRALCEAVRPTIQTLAQGGPAAYHGDGRKLRDWLATARAAGAIAGPDGTYRWIDDAVGKLIRDLEQTEEAEHGAITE